MEPLINKFIYNNWQRKITAILIGLIIWFFVNQTITATKTIPSVPIRIIGLPVDKTVHGLLPNGFLSQRTAITFQGTKEVVEKLEPGDVEVVLDVSNLPNEGVVQITKKNLISLDPNTSLSRHITNIAHPELVIKMSRILTEEIPVYILPPKGTPPKGYSYLDIWPRELKQTLSGPEEYIEDLRKKGLEIHFNLDDIKEDLSNIHSSSNPLFDDEVVFSIPEEWKTISIPFPNNITESLNDPNAKNLQISFLKLNSIPLKTELPIHLFFPLKTSEQANPDIYTIASGFPVSLKNSIPVLEVPLIVKNVSKLFLDIVKDNMEIDIVIAPKEERESLAWSIGFIDINHMEDSYVALQLNQYLKTSNGPYLHQTEKEAQYRERFRHYLQNFSLYLTDNQPLEIDASLQDKKVLIRLPQIKK